MNEAYGYIYAITTSPEELQAKHKHAAKYGDFILFCEGYEAVTGKAPTLIVNLAEKGLQPDDADPYEVGVLTHSEFDAMIIRMMGEEPTGIEVQLSRSQVHHLYNGMFKREEANEPV